MLNAFKFSRAQGYTRTVVVGTDCLTLTVEDINQAFKKLSKYDCVLGPSKDGGYYLIGLKNPLDCLFNHIPWSTSQVLKLTLEKLHQLKKRVFLLKEKEDIDTIASLKRHVWGKGNKMIMSNTDSVIIRIPQLV